MKLYHGSRNGELLNIKKMQAQSDERLVIPDNELKNAIYLTPNYEYALAMAARPEGITHIGDDKTIKFEKPDLYNPEQEVYVYEVEVDDSVARQIDDNQFIVENVDEIKPIFKNIHKAGEIEKYYEIKEWQEKEILNDQNLGFKNR